MGAFWDGFEKQALSSKLLRRASDKARQLTGVAAKKVQASLPAHEAKNFSAYGHLVGGPALPHTPEAAELPKRVRQSSRFGIAAQDKITAKAKATRKANEARKAAERAKTVFEGGG